MPDDLPDTTAPLTDLPHQGEPVELSAEESAALERVLAALAFGGYSSPRPVASAPRTAPEPAGYIRVAYDARPPFADIATPPEVMVADEAMQAEIAVDNEVHAAFADLPAREAAERAEVGRMAVAGEKVPRSPTGPARSSFSWPSTRPRSSAPRPRSPRTRLPSRRLCRHGGSACSRRWTPPTPRRGRHGSTPRSGPRWRGGAPRRLRRHRSTPTAFPDKPLTTSPVPRDIKPFVGEGQRAAETLNAYLRSDHPAVTRSYLHRKPGEFNPPMWVREALNESATGASKLHAIEVAERFRHRNYTADMAERRGLMPDECQAEPWSNSATSI